MRTAGHLCRVLVVLAGVTGVLSTAGCTDGGTELDYTVAATATDDGTRDTAATTDPDDIAAVWSEVTSDGRPEVPGGQVEVLVSASYLLGQPTVSAVRDNGDTWTVHLSAYDLDGCDMPAVVNAVTYLLHVTASAAPAAIDTDVDMTHGCPS